MNFLLKLLIIVSLPFFLYAKVYDCFPFFNELELLQMRLEELNDTVDYFVLVESIETQRGNSKTLYFTDNYQLFEKFLHKIIHVEIHERHPEMGMWEREHYQRNCIMRGLQHCQPNDVILVSDVDEIPRPSVLQMLIKNLLAPQTISRRQNNPNTLPERYYGLQMGMYRYQLNRQEPGTIWLGTVATTYHNLTLRNPQFLRNIKDNVPSFPNGGWHFSNMGGKDRVRLKVCSLVEGRSDCHALTDEQIEGGMKAHPVVSVDDSFPFYMKKNEAYLKSIGFIADY